MTLKHIMTPLVLVLLKCFICKDLLNSESVQMEPNVPVRVHLVPFVHSQSYTPLKVIRGSVCFW